MKKRNFNMERKHTLKKSTDLKELFEICSDVICQLDEEDALRVLKALQSLIRIPLTRTESF